MNREQYIAILEVENAELKKKTKNLIKYLEDKIKEPQIGGCDMSTTNRFETERKVYQDILERLKSGKYE